MNVKYIPFPTLAFLSVLLNGCASYSPPQQDNTTALIDIKPEKIHNMTIAHICGDDGYLSLIGRIYDSPEANLDYLFLGSKKLSTVISSKKPVTLNIGTKGCHSFFSFQPAAGGSYEIVLNTSNPGNNEIVLNTSNPGYNSKLECTAKVYLNTENQTGRKGSRKIVPIKKETSCRRKN